MKDPAQMSDFTMPTYRRHALEYVSGQGATLFDARGRDYIDLLAGIAVASVGHCHPRVVEAIRNQSKSLIHVSNLFFTRPQAALAERLAALTDGMLSFFCNSGAEAVECALKLARKWARGQGKKDVKIVCSEGSFHGRTLGALAATGQFAKRRPFEPMLDGFVHVPYGDPTALEMVVDDSVAAVLLEPILGEAGVVVPPPGYLRRARELCDRAGALLIVDEVQTGLGRTGRWFAYQHDGVAPDITCLAKALGGGLPLGACLARRGVAEAFAFSDHASTFGGGPVQTAAALAALEVIEGEDLLTRADVLGRSLSLRLKDTFDESVEVRGRGLLIGIDLGEPRARALVDAGLAHGVVVNEATPRVVRLAPPLVISEEELVTGLERLANAWREVCGEG